MGNKDNAVPPPTRLASTSCDYFNGPLRGIGAAIGLDHYGRQQFGLQATSASEGADRRGAPHARRGGMCAARRLDREGPSSPWTWSALERM